MIIKCMECIKYLLTLSFNDRLNYVKRSVSVNLLMILGHYILTINYNVLQL